MALVIIADDCMHCGKCVSTCSARAISNRDRAFVIDPTLCTECKECQSACPVNCIRHPQKL